MSYIPRINQQREIINNFLDEEGVHLFCQIRPFFDRCIDVQKYVQQNVEGHITCLSSQRMLNSLYSSVELKNVKLVLWSFCLNGFGDIETLQKTWDYFKNKVRKITNISIYVDKGDGSYGRKIKEFADRKGMPLTTIGCSNEKSNLTNPLDPEYSSKDDQQRIAEQLEKLSKTLITQNVKLVHKLKNNNTRIRIHDPNNPPLCLGISQIVTQINDTLFPRLRDNYSKQDYDGLIYFLKYASKAATNNNDLKQYLSNIRKHCDILRYFDSRKYLQELLLSNRDVKEIINSNDDSIQDIVLPAINSQFRTILEPLSNNKENIIWISECSDVEAKAKKDIIMRPMTHFMFGVKLKDLGLCFPREVTEEGISFHNIKDPVVREMIFETQDLKSEDIEKFREENSFYFFYQNKAKDFSVYQAACLANHEKKNCVICMPMEYSDVQRLNLTALEKQNIGKIVFKKRGEARIQRIFVSEEGKKDLVIINPFPLYEDFDLLFHLNYLLNVITGDGSAIKALLSGRPFFYTTENHKIDFLKDLLFMVNRRIESDACKYFFIYSCLSALKGSGESLENQIDGISEKLFPQKNRVVKQFVKKEKNDVAEKVSKLLKKDECRKGFAQLSEIIRKEYDALVCIEHIIKRNYFFNNQPQLMQIHKKVNEQIISGELTPLEAYQDLKNELQS